MKKSFFPNGEVTPKGVEEAIKEIDPFENDLYKRTDDIGTSRLFSDIFSNVLRYNTTAKEWYFYDGIVWRIDLEGMNTEKYAKIFQRALYIYSADIQDDRYRKYVASLGDRKKRTTMIQDARETNCVCAEDLDKDLSLFNCQNCVINLDTFEVMEHRSDLLLSKVANVQYNKEATSGEWEKFLFEVMCGDEVKTQYLQELFGYAMTGDCAQEECYLLYGATTRNGKSTTIETVSNMFGDYSMNIQPESLAQRKVKDSRTASGDIARLDGCRLLHMSEPPKRMNFDVALLKTLLGKDKITARHLHEREKEFVPIFKLFINTNYLPVVTDDTLFSSGRVKVITFDRHFSEDEQDIKLKSRLMSEDNMSGILNWCLEGLKRYHSNKDRLSVPPAVKNATDEYRKKSDKIQNFIDECLFKSEGNNLTAKEVYAEFEKWCQSNGYGTENKQNFLDELRSKGILSQTGTVRGKTVKNVVKGYSLENSEDPESDLFPFQ